MSKINTAQVTDTVTETKQKSSVPLMVFAIKKNSPIKILNYNNLHAKK